MQGIAVENVTIRAEVGGKKKAVEGAMIFTANGLGGPAAFDLSREITDTLFDGHGPVKIAVDVAPRMDLTALDAHLIEQCQLNSRREMAAVLVGLLPRGLAIQLTTLVEPSCLVLAGHMKKEQRRLLADLIKGLPLTVTATAPLAQATVTRGGVELSEIDPKTMQSLKCPGLYFAGETLNADGPCGGYNLQIAWSTGTLAGRSAVTKVLAAEERNQ